MKYSNVFDEEQCKILEAIEKEMTEELHYIFDDQMISVLSRGFLEGKQYMRDKMEEKIKIILFGGDKS